VSALAESTFSCSGDFTAAVADVLNFIQPSLTAIHPAPLVSASCLELPTGSCPLSPTPFAFPEASRAPPNLRSASSRAPLILSRIYFFATAHFFHFRPHFLLHLSHFSMPICHKKIYLMTFCFFFQINFPIL